jgi:hypothetical protein
MNNGLEGSYSDVIEVLSWNLPGETEESHGSLVPRLRFELRTLRMLANGANSIVPIPKSSHDSVALCYVDASLYRTYKLLLTLALQAP